MRHWFKQERNMPILKVGAISALALMLTAPVPAHAADLTDSFNHFGHSLVRGAKQAGHAAKNGATNVGHSIVSGWHSLERKFSDR
jgi:hypothetical protein